MEPVNPVEQHDDIRGSLSSAGNSGQDGCAFAVKKKKNEEKNNLKALSKTIIALNRLYHLSSLRANDALGSSVFV